MNSKELARSALIQWRNRIQTGDACLATQDAINQGSPELCRMLSYDQQELVIQLEELAQHLLDGGSV